MFNDDKRHPKLKKQTEAGSYNDSLSERLFYKHVDIDLSEAQDGSNVKTIRKPRKTKVILILVAILVVLGVSFIPFNYDNDVHIKWNYFFRCFKEMFTPNELRTKTAAGWWSFSWNSFAVGINSTLVNSTSFLQIFEICFIGTFLGGILSIPVYYACAHNVNKNPYFRIPFKLFNNFLRCVPMFIFCIMFGMLMGSGNILPAILAIGVFSLGIMYQMMYEYLETLNMRPFESMRSGGASNLQSVWLGLHPEVKPMFFAYWLYTLEINIRASVILSYVGITSTFINSLQTYIQYGWYDYVGAMVVPLFLVVATLQIVSNVLVRKLR